MILRPLKKEAKRHSDPRERSLWADLMAVGMVFPIAIVIGLFLGRWIGGKFGHPEMGQWIGLAWGVAAAFWDLFKTSQKLDRYQAADAKDREEQRAREGQRPLPRDHDGDDDQP